MLSLLEKGIQQKRGLLFTVFIRLCCVGVDTLQDIRSCPLEELQTYFSEIMHASKGMIQSGE